MAYYSAISNPFLKLEAPAEASHDHFLCLQVGKPKWKKFRKRVLELGQLYGNIPPTNAIV